MKQTVKTSRAAGQLEKMFRELNKHYYNGELPEPIISLKKTPSAYGHITVGKVWQAGQESKYEIAPLSFTSLCGLSLPDSILLSGCIVPPITSSCG